MSVSLCPGQNRAKGGIEGTHKVPFAHEHAYIETLQEAVEVLKPTAIIGRCCLLANASAVCLLGLFGGHHAAAVLTKLHVSCCGVCLVY